MAHTLRAVTFAALASSTTRTVNKPTGTVDGDLIVIGAYREDNSDDLTSGPSGFTEIASEVVNTGPTPDVRLRVWYKIASSEGASWTVTWSAADFSELICIASNHTNGYPSNPVDDTTTGTGNGATPGTAGVTATVADTLKVLIAANYDGDAYTNGATGMTERGDGSALGLFTEEQAASGASGAEACAIAGAQWAARLIAFKPNTGGSPIVVEPDEAVAQTEVAGPTVVLGSHSVAPAVASAAASRVNPAVVLGAHLVAPAAAAAATSRVNPSVVNATIYTPAAAIAGASVVAPTVGLGAHTVAPAVATAQAEVADPTVALGGGTTVAPTAASAVAVTTGANAQRGNIVATPLSAAGSRARVVDPTVLLGAILVAPAAAIAQAEVTDPTVSIAGGGLASPAAATAVAAVQGPTVLLGSHTVSPAAAIAQAEITAPGAVAGSHTVAPSAAIAVAGTIAPTVATGGSTPVVPSPAQAATGTGGPTAVRGSVAANPAPATARTKTLLDGDVTGGGEGASGIAESILGRLSGILRKLLDYIN